MRIKMSSFYTLFLSLCAELPDRKLASTCPPTPIPRCHVSDRVTGRTDVLIFTGRAGLHVNESPFTSFYSFFPACFIELPQRKGREDIPGLLLPQALKSHNDTEQVSAGPVYTQSRQNIAHEEVKCKCQVRWLISFYIKTNVGNTHHF